MAAWLESFHWVTSPSKRIRSRCWQLSAGRAPIDKRPVVTGRMEIDAIDLLPFYAISDDDVRRAGEADRESLRKRAAHAGPIRDDTVLYRIEFHVV